MRSYLEIALWRAKNRAGRGIAYATPVLMFGVAGKLVYDVANNIMQRNAAKQQTAPKAEPQVKATSFRQ